VAREGLEVADVFHHFGPAFRDQHGTSLSSARRNAMTAIERCRTAALGGHVEQCGDCGHQRISFNSCRNRNCPKCQGLARAKWLEDRGGRLRRDSVSVPLSGSSAGWVQSVPLPDLTQGGLSPDRGEARQRRRKFMLPQPAADCHSKNTPASVRQDLNAAALYCRS
jgi:hypothetical protein